MEREQWVRGDEEVPSRNENLKNQPSPLLEEVPKVL